jgi:hypothetical protein
VGLPPRRPLLVAFGGADRLAVVRGQGLPDDTLWYFERGWALMLGAWFVHGGRRCPPRWRFLPRALAALAATTVTAAA